MEVNFNKHLGSKLRIRRLALGLTQTKVAQAISVTFQQIQKYEKGKNGVSTIILIQISNFFGKPLEYFTSDATELVRQVKPLTDSSDIAPELSPELH